MLTQLNDTALSQERITSNVIAQFVVLGVAVSLIAVLASLFVTRSIASPLAGLADTASKIAVGDLSLSAEVTGEDEIGALAEAFNSMTDQLRAMIGTLEERVAERTADLERRSAYLQASAAVGQAVASLLDPDALTTQVVELIRERFGLYYVGLLLIDPAQESAVLQAGTGEAGRAMLARHHRVALGQGMVGWSIVHAQARVALQAEADAVRVVTPELPETRSEAALPLRSRGRVLGALTVQSVETEAFDSDAVSVLQTMADQVAVALDNAQLFAESQAAREAAETAYGQLTRAAWQELLRVQPDIGFRRDRNGLAPVGTADTSAADGTEQPAYASTPIKVRGQEIGVIHARKPEAAGDWTAEETEVMEALADQLGVALESARLFRDARRRAAHEEAVRHVTEEMRRGLEVESILQTTVAELGRVLGVPRAYVRLGAAAKSEPKEPGPEE